MTSAWDQLLLWQQFAFRQLMDLGAGGGQGAGLGVMGTFHSPSSLGVFIIIGSG